MLDPLARILVTRTYTPLRLAGMLDSKFSLLGLSKVANRPTRVTALGSID